MFDTEENIFIFNKIYLYSIKYSCIQSTIFILNEKYFCSNTRERYFK